jgi:cellulose synthase/poly-beta-1,6-N-acetylglucosamine synthase-like glycosyltransferase
MQIAVWLMVAAVGIPLYAYVAFPLLLMALAGLRQRVPAAPVPPTNWPLVSVSLPAYNEAASIGRTLDRLLATDYPPECRQILVISDASTDGTDEIVREYAARGVELLRLDQRSGKTAAENAARTRLRGAIVVNTDASVAVHAGALRALVAAFAAPDVGVASGRDVSMGSTMEAANAGESGYVGYEMWVRRLETRVGGIVGASGCLYAIRSDLHDKLVPEAMSRDFAAPLIAREHGFRAVSVDDAICFVPRTASLHREYRRKVRTMTRGLETLFYKRALLNPFRHGVFAWKLFSHKLARWLLPWACVLGVGSVGWLAVSHPWARLMVGAGLVVMAVAAGVWWWPAGRTVSRPLAVVADLVTGVLAGLHAWTNALRGELNPVWEPTPRPAGSAAEKAG